LADVGGNDMRAVVRHGDSAGAADALAGCCDQGAFALKPLVAHVFPPVRSSLNEARIVYAVLAFYLVLQAFRL
jgi:hypothetical protein